MEIWNHPETEGFNRKKNPNANIFCANCGCIGHVYKSCNHPVISYGIICYYLFYDAEQNIVFPKYLMVQRKDSLSYVEFIRGKYDVQNIGYLMKLFSLMTPIERARILNNTEGFETLWAEMWCKDKTDKENNKNFNKELVDSTRKFNLLKSGFLIKQNYTNQEMFLNIDYLINNTMTLYTETEWGFPKGRRNINEDDISCAIREFREETGIPGKSIRLCHDIKPCEEIFSGTNKVRYKHVYYIARYNTFYMESFIKHPCKEIKDARWFSFTEAQEHIRGHNVERKELLKRINTAIIRGTII